MGLAVAGIGVSGLSAIRPFGLSGDAGSSISSGPAEESSGGGADAGSAAGADSAMLAPAEKLNLCGGQLAEVAPSATGLVATTQFPDSAAGTSAVEGVVTITNTGTAAVSGTTSAVPSVTLSQDGLVLWHSNGPIIAMVVEVALEPGESQTYQASFTPVRCEVEDDLGESFRDGLPALEPGTYEVSAAIYLIDEDGAPELITGPALARAAGLTDRRRSIESGMPPASTREPSIRSHRSFRTLGLRRRAMTGGAGLLLAVMAVGGGVLGSGVAHAENPPDLAGAMILDTVGVLSPAEAQVQSALDRLETEAGVQMFVVVVDRFDGVPVTESWATATAVQNRLGDGDILFAIATETRNYDVSYPDGFALDESATDAVEQDATQLLGNDDWANGVITAADGYREALTSPTGGGSGTAIVVVVVAVAAVIIGVIILRRRRRTRGQANGTSTPAGPSQEELDAQAGRLLVQLDDAIKTSGQELGFAVAQFGEDVARPFSDALASATAQVGEAFRLRQLLDDAQPETPEQRREMSTKIIELCTSADETLDAQADAFDELRTLERDADAGLARATATRSQRASGTGDGGRPDGRPAHAVFRCRRRRCRAESGPGPRPSRPRRTVGDGCRRRAHRR